MKQFILGILISLIIGLFNFVYTQKIAVEQLEFIKGHGEAIVTLQVAVIELLK